MDKELYAILDDIRTLLKSVDAKLNILCGKSDSDGTVDFSGLFDISTSVPEPAPEPELEPISFSEPELMPVADPEPMPEFSVMPEPAPEALSEPMPEFNMMPEPAPEALSEPMPEYNETPVVEMMPEPEIKVESETIHAPQVDVEPEMKKAVIDVMAAKEAWRTDMPGTEVRDVRSAISLNDRVLFINGLFGQDPLKFQAAIEKLNNTSHFSEAVDWLRENHPQWDMDSDVVYRFMMALRRKIRN